MKEKTKNQKSKKPNYSVKSLRLPKAFELVSLLKGDVPVGQRDLLEFVKKLGFSLILLISLTLAQSIPSFSEESSTVSAHVYDGGFEYFTGGGVAVFDCNDDGFPELYMAGGENSASFFLNKSQSGGELVFEKTEHLSLTNVTGAYPIDIDADSLIDLAILRVGQNRFFKGVGNCQFVEANGFWQLEDDSSERASDASNADSVNPDIANEWSTAFSAAWFAGDTWPTLAVGNFIDMSQKDSPFGTCAKNQLFRPVLQAGTVTYTSTFLEPSYCTLSLLFSDWDRSGVPSLRISNDRQYYLTNKDRTGSEQLFYLQNDAFVPYSEQDGWRPLKIWGMGIASTDINQDGYPDYYLTSMSDSKLQFLKLSASTSVEGTLAESAADAPTYTDGAYKRGITAHIANFGDVGMPSTGWHAEFADVNNDGLDDLFVTKGNVEAMSGFAQKDPNNLFIQNPDGGFYDVALEAGLLSGERGRGAAVVDLNKDGQLDVVVVNRKAGAQVWRNMQTQGGNWLELRLSHPNNSYGIGSFIELEFDGKTINKELTLGGGHASGHLGFTHFGLGDSQEARVKVYWFDGQESPWFSLKANERYTLNFEDIKE